MIQTKEYALTKQDYLKILSIQRLRRSWLVFTIIILVAVFNLVQFGMNGFPTFIVIYAILYPALLFFTIVRWVNSKDNKNFYRPMQLTFAPDKLTILSGQTSVFDTPTTSEIAYDTIIKKQEISSYYLLYVSKNSFLIIPQNVFKAEEDKEAFRKLLSFK